MEFLLISILVGFFGGFRGYITADRYVGPYKGIYPGSELTEFQLRGVWKDGSLQYLFRSAPYIGLFAFTVPIWREVTSVILLVSIFMVASWIACHIHLKSRVSLDIAKKKRAMDDRRENRPKPSQ